MIGAASGGPPTAHAVASQTLAVPATEAAEKGPVDGVAVPIAARVADKGGNTGAGDEDHKDLGGDHAPHGAGDRVITVPPSLSIGAPLADSEAKDAAVPNFADLTFAKWDMADRAISLTVVTTAIAAGIMSGMRSTGTILGGDVMVGIIPDIAAGERQLVSPANRAPNSWRS